MNRNSEIIAIVCIAALGIIFIILSLMATAEHYEWIETELLGTETTTVIEKDIVDTVYYQFANGQSIPIYSISKDTITIKAGKYCMRTGEDLMYLGEE